uniref:Uncharacterized protein n=1 Tax=Heterorhabditis bacteriophora TaxID=37862 RepID=A0A1I7WGE1_HETBA
MCQEGSRLNDIKSIYFSRSALTHSNVNHVLNIASPEPTILTTWPAIPIAPVIKLPCRGNIPKSVATLSVATDTPAPVSISANTLIPFAITGIWAVKYGSSSSWGASLLQHYAHYSDTYLDYYF